MLISPLSCPSSHFKSHLLIVDPIVETEKASSTTELKDTHLLQSTLEWSSSCQGYIQSFNVHPVLLLPASRGTSHTLSELRYSSTKPHINTLFPHHHDQKRITDLRQSELKLPLSTGKAIIPRLDRIVYAKPDCINDSYLVR